MRSLLRSPSAMVGIAMLALLATAADMIRDTTGLSLNPAYLLHAIVYWAGFLLVFRLGEAGLDWLAREPAAEHRGTPLITLPSAYHLRGVARITAIIFVCWLPMLVLLFPGVIWYDSRQQLLQFFHLPNRFTSGALSDHHPVFDTLLYGSFVQVGRWLGSADLGAYLFTLCQALLTAAALACMVILVRRCGATRRAALALLAFLALFPMLPIYAGAMAKDATFLPFLLLFTVCVVETLRSKGAVLRRPSRFAALLAAAVLMSLTRKTGVLIVVVTCVTLVCAVRTIRARVASAMTAVLCVLLMAVVMPLCVLPALHAVPGGSQEALGLMYQQSARLLRDHDEVPDWQRDAIERQLGDDAANRYSWWITDTVKDPLSGVATDGSYQFADDASDGGDARDSATDASGTTPTADYLRAWAAGLAEHPITYLEAYLAVEVGWFAVPNMADGNTIMYLMPIDAHETDHIFAGSDAIGFRWSSDVIGQWLEAVHDWIEGTPFGMLLGSKAMWTTWMMVFLIVESRRRDRERTCWLVVLIAANAVLWVSPTSVTREAMRYMLPLLFLVPVFLALIARTDGNRHDNSPCSSSHS